MKVAIWLIGAGTYSIEEVELMFDNSDAAQDGSQTRLAP